MHNLGNEREKGLPLAPPTAWQRFPLCLNMSVISADVCIFSARPPASTVDASATGQRLSDLVPALDQVTTGHGYHRQRQRRHHGRHRLATGQARSPVPASSTRPPPVSDCLIWCPALDQVTAGHGHGHRHRQRQRQRQRHGRHRLATGQARSPVPAPSTRPPTGSNCLIWC